MTWRMFICGLAAWLAALMPAAAQAVDWADLLAGADRMAMRVFEHRTARGVGNLFAVVEFTDAPDAAAAFEPLAVALAGDYEDDERTTSAPDLGDRAIAFTGRVPAGPQAVVVVLDDTRLLIAVGVNRTHDPLPYLLTLTEPLFADDRGEPDDLAGYLPDETDLPETYNMSRDVVRDFAAERLATPVP